MLPADDSTNKLDETRYLSLAKFHYQAVIIVNDSQYHVVSSMAEVGNSPLLKAMARMVEQVGTHRQGSSGI